MDEAAPLSLGERAPRSKGDPSCIQQRAAEGPAWERLKLRARGWVRMVLGLRVQAARQPPLAELLESRCASGAPVSPSARPEAVVRTP